MKSVAALVLIVCAGMPLEADGNDVVLNGVRLHYRVAGSPAGPTVVFLHGGPGYNSHSFAALAGPQLERNLQMVYPDQRGSGRSERPWDKAYSIDILVEDVEALRKHLRAPEIVVMGHSFGGTLALEYAARYPKQVSKVVIIDGLSDGPASIDVWRARLLAEQPQLSFPPLPGGDACEHTKATQAVINRSISSDAKAFFDRLQFRDQKFRILQDEVDAKSGLQNTGELSNALFSKGLACYRFAAFDKLAMPVLVLGGRFDGAIGIEPMRALASKLPHAVFVEYENSAHFPYLEERDRFVGDVMRFLGSSQQSSLARPESRP
jgi:proline iminopeptidase